MDRVSGAQAEGLRERLLQGFALAGGNGWISFPSKRLGVLRTRGWQLAQPTGTKDYCLSVFTAAPSSPPWTPSRRCGCPKRSMKKTVPARFIAKPSNAQGGWTYWERGRRGEPEPLTPFGLGSCSRPRVPCMPRPRSRWCRHARLQPPLPLCSAYTHRHTESDV